MHPEYRFFKLSGCFQLHIKLQFYIFPWDIFILFILLMIFVNANTLGRLGIELMHRPCRFHK